MISYALSMIPPWREALAHALDVVAPGGALHIVDFGDCAGLPGAVQGGVAPLARGFPRSRRARISARRSPRSRARGG